MTRIKKINVRFALLSAFFAFFTLIISNVVTFFAMFMFLTSGIIDLPPLERDGTLYIPGIFIFLFQNSMVSLTLGFFLSFFGTLHFSNPIKTLVSAINELSKGNFDVRIHLREKGFYGELNDSFNRMAKELGSVELLRNDFVNDFSHEFKTPIVSIQGFARLLQSPDLTEEERSEYLAIIVNESERLTSLASNILLLSRLENQNIVSQNTCFHVAEQLRNCILMLESKWSAKNLELDLHLEELSFYGNETMIQQIWINLLDNAIKFSDNGGTVEISLGRKDIDGNPFLCCRIKNGGCVIEADKRKKIFQKFYQTDSSHSTKGNGLGLAIVARITELHKGSVKLSDVDQDATVFEVTLPLNTAEIIL